MFDFFKKKNFVDRHPSAAHIYRQLTPHQKKILDDFSYKDEKYLSEDKKIALQRIMGVYVTPLLSASLTEKELKKRTQLVFDACKSQLQRSQLTVNINAKLFKREDFFHSKGVETCWTIDAGKGFQYSETRQAVEEHAFEFKIEWDKPIALAAMERPVYAGLNFVDHPYGCAVAYGSVNLVLKQKLVDRCTFINTDTFDADFKFESSSAAQRKICTVAHIERLVAFLSDRQLKALCEKAESTYFVGDHPPNYIEAQVHGGVTWAQDIECIRVATTGDHTLDKESASAKSTPATLKYLIGEFAKKHSVRASLYRLDLETEVLNQ